MISVLGIGDNTVDRYMGQGRMYPGGNAVNVAVHAKRLGYKSAYIGCLAKDIAGKLIHDSLIKEGVDVSRTRQVDGKNAFCNIHLENGDRVFGTFSEGVCDQLTLDENDLAFISTFDLVHTSVYSFMDTYLPALQSNAKFLSYDFSSEWDKASLAEILPLLDFALISNPVENIKDNSELLEWAVTCGPKLAMATSGAKGAAIFDGRNFYSQDVIPISAVRDTLGAGDAFVARFLTAYLEGKSIATALEKAAHYAAEKCMHFGAFGHGADI